jgi:hypothetical protein
MIKFKGAGLPEGYSWDSSLQLGDETAHLTNSLWPNFLVEESDIADSSLELEISEAELSRRFRQWGIRRDSDQKLVAYLSAILISADLSTDVLPDSGWQFAMQSVCSSKAPNCMCLIVANVLPEARQLGLAQILLEKSKEVTKESGFSTLIAPVRPTAKSEFPDLTIAEYVERRSASNEIADPWLRTHSKLGGEVLNVCNESVVVTATLKKWREWTGLALEKSGAHPLIGGLAPLHVDVEKNVGAYREPNVWVRYRL